MLRSSSLLSIGLLAAFNTVGCVPGGDLISNPDVELWCGSVPCGWEASGKVSRVGSWDEHDYSVSLDSDHATLSQLNRVASGYSAPCIDFALVAKIDEGTHVSFELDFLDDGIIDASEELKARDWDRVAFNLAAPSWYEAVRFIVRKDGSGTAIVGHLSAEVSTTCANAPLPLNNRPEGATCERDEQCAQGTCDDIHIQYGWGPRNDVRGVCGQSCEGDNDCEPGDACQLLLSDAFSDSLGLCGEQGTSAFGQPCIDNGQCETGVCCEGACSTCCEDRGCADGEACGPALWPIDNVLESEVQRGYRKPYLCAPGMLRAAEGARCTIPVDCKSAECADAPGLLCSGVPCLGSACAQCQKLSIQGGVCE